MANVTNTSTNAINKNAIIPDVYAQLVREKITGKTKVAQFCKHIGDLHSKIGETLTMPAWSYIGDAADWNISTPMTSTHMKQTTRSATVKAIAAPAVKVADYDDETELGSALNEAAGQQAVSIARKYDIDAIAESLKSPLKVKLAKKNEVTEDEILSMLALYGDDRDSSDFDAIVIHSAFAKSFYKMSMFVSRELTTSTEHNGIAVNGCIGRFLDIPVVLSDRLYDAESQEGFILMMKKGAIGLIPKESPHAEAARDASLRQTIVYCSQFYAMALIDDTAVVFAKNVLPTASESATE